MLFLFLNANNQQYNEINLNDVNSFIMVFATQLRQICCQIILWKNKQIKITKDVAVWLVPLLFHKWENLHKKDMSTNTALVKNHTAK
jgi:hypothetical protein